jgi:ubiquinone/menaquinone biosynthesis C-methylase UbiE
MSATEHEYLLGTNAAELARLGFQHQVWAAATAEAWERAGFGPGARLLDVGCGPGYATLDLADLVGPTGHVLGVDASARFVAHLDAERRRRGVAHVEVRVLELEQLDLPPESVDGAFVRWVLCYLRDPGDVVARIARALRPGASLAVMDYVHYTGFTVAPTSDAIERVIQAVARSFARAGGNADVGRDLPGHMRAAGLEVRSLRPLVRLARPGSALWDWPTTFFANYLPTLVTMGEISDAERLAFAHDWEARSRAPDAFLLTPPMLEVVAVKPA